MAHCVMAVDGVERDGGRGRIRGGEGREERDGPSWLAAPQEAEISVLPCLTDTLSPRVFSVHLL